MAIDQVKTISELERLEELLDSYAVAISTGATTGSATLLALSNFLKTYLQDVSKRVQTVDNSPDNYPSTAAVTGYAQTLANLVQDLTSPSATTYLSTEGVKNESDRIISIMDIKRRLNYGTAFDISGSFYVGSAAYKVPINGLLCVSITTSSQPSPRVYLRIANSGTASTSSPVFAVWGHNGGGAEHNIAPVTIPVFSGNSCYLENVGGGGVSLAMACIIPYSDN